MEYNQAMTKQQVTRAALHLRPEEQLELALLLWEHAQLSASEPPSELRHLLKLRVAAAKANPGESESWEEVEAQLWPKG